MTSIGSAAKGDRSALTEALEAARARYARARPVSAELFERARRVLPAGSTRSVLDMTPFPFRVANATGARLTDVDGHEYLDLLGDYSAGLLGHDPVAIAAAVRARLDQGWSLGAMHADEIRLAELICARFPSIEQVRFTNSGTEANLMAVQLARHHTGNEEVIAFEGAYHGGLLYFGPGGEAMRAPFEVQLARFNDLDSVDAAFRAAAGRVACVLIEPMMGAGGCLPAMPGFLEGVRQRCDAADALLVFDEVMTSRMSAGGAQQRLGVLPDLTTLGKYLAGGMTFGAFGGRAEVMAAFDPSRGGALVHGGTFNNNAVSMAAGVATLAEVLTAEVLDQLFQRGEQLRDRLDTVLSGTRMPMQITGWGSMLAFHTVAGPVRSPADAGAADPVLKELWFHELLHRGIYSSPRGFMALSIALEPEDLDQVVDAFAETLAVIEPLLGD